MKVRDIMTVNVAAVGPDATLKQVAELMADRGVSGVPVVDAGRPGPRGRLRGGHHRQGGKPSGEGRRSRRLFAPEGLDERRLVAATAGEAMTDPSSPSTPANPSPRRRGSWSTADVNRLPVLVDGKLVGIVSRADIVRAFTRSDSEIWEELRNDILPRQLWISPDELDVDVTGGRVTVAGRVATRTEAELVEAFAWRVPGVVSVDCSELTWESDDRARRAAQLR